MTDTHDTNLPEMTAELEEEKKTAEVSEAETAETPAEEQTMEKTVETPPAQRLTKEEVIERLKAIASDVESVTKAEIDSLKQTFYKLHNAEQEAARKQFAEEGGAPEDYVPTNRRFSRVMGWFHEEGMTHQRTDTIYIDDLDRRQYLWVGDADENGRGKTYRMVDAFAQLEREGASADVELKVSPVTLAPVSFTRDPGEGTEDRQPVTLHLPAMNEGTTIEEEEGTEPAGPTPLPELIRNGAEAEDSNSTLSLAFYSGLSDIYVSGSSHSYPIPYIDEYRDNEHSNPTTTVSNEYVKTNSVGATLRLATLDKLFYQSTYDIDYRHAVKLTSHDPNLYDARFIFEIRHKRYVCREMEFTLDANGRKGAWTGTFYPIRISDTEADARWILTDGRWRDGGVWLDNGRWLDDPT